MDDELQAETYAKQALTEFGERVRYFRQKKGWSQEELAHQADLHRTYLGAIERGERNVSLKNIARIALALGVSIGDLFPTT